MSRLTGIILICAAMIGLPVTAWADGQLPRFVSVKTGEARIRSGPGTQYPIEWVLVRPDLPIEITAEFDVWRKVRDWEGVEGWVHRRTLTSRRTVMVIDRSVVPLRAEADDRADVVARAEPGVVGPVLRCPPPEDAATGWCYVDLDGHRGWAPRTALWGVYPDEIIQ